ncbi:MAG: membrane integrity-associated transporter subunit PqiC [Gammaproteobacteria bacterium]|nr:membrane integrity-associated transporter subunit PqiC [Gammaproteobacteria bacterium]
MKTILWVLIAAVLAACSILPKPAPPPVLHDFGPPASAPAAAVPVEVSVSAPLWLDDTAIYYRLMYSDPTQLRAYADHRWLAPPAQLLQARLRGAFANRSPHYRLEVQLLDFEQVFDTAQSAHISLRAQASLRDLSSGTAIGERMFAVTQSTSPDVQGAVSGDAQAANELLARLEQWVHTQLAPDKSP